MTEQRQAQHFEASAALLRAHIENLRQQLVERQLEEYPDSRIMTEDEVRNEWVDNIPAHIRERIEAHCDERAAKLQRLGVKVEEVKNAYAEERRMMFRQEMNHIARCVLLAMSNSPVRVFYECGKNEDGTYKFRGCRYGVQGYEYMSGFSRF